MMGHRITKFTAASSLRSISRYRSTGSVTDISHSNRLKDVPVRAAGDKGQPQSGYSTYTDTKDNTYSSEKETHFGYETVSEKEKSRKVKDVFEKVAQRYDTMNDVMSGGVHRIWKDIFMSRLGPGQHTKFIDVAGGTGDIAFRFLKYTKVKPNLSFNSPFPVSILSSSEAEFKKFTGRLENEVEAMQVAAKTPYQAPDTSTSGPTTRTVLVCDINPKMLEVGKERSKSILTPDQLKRIDWLEGDAENLHTIPDNSFDAYTIAFGIRNCVHIDKVLEEAFRVLRPGGKFMCLEFSHVENPIVKWAYDEYSFQLIPVMGQIIAGDWDSYQYLVESIRKFPTQEQFKGMIEDAGFRFTRYEDLTFGVAAIHTGFKV